MNLNISQLKERVTAAKFSDVEQLGDTIIRCTKKAGHEPFAVYYFDVAENLPSTKEQLIKYQDRIIGSRYFDGRKSLQWSNYLYFLSDDTKLSDENIRIAKELIELDRSYARKFVITEKELGSIIAPSIVFPVDETPQENVLSVWSDILAEKGLDTIVLSDESLPTRLKLIEDSSAESLIRTKSQKLQEKVPAAPFINSLELVRFRDFPITRNFTFGSVNLFYGVNGSGKTSLLEAIELFYCGKNKRNPSLSPEYTFRTVLADNKAEKVNSRRSLQEFRNRNLLWYGQSEVRTNNLYQSFAQFNFLDTDAAVSLSDSTLRLEEDLSKLLVGPEASKAWKDIQRVNEAVIPQARSLHKQKVQVKEELDEIEKILNEIGNIKNESDSIHKRLKSMIERIGWNIAENDKELFASRLVEELSELLAIVQQATAIEWAATPVSIEGLNQYCLETKKICEKVEPEIHLIEELREEQEKIESDQKRYNKARDIILHIKELVSIGLPDIVSERNTLQDTTSNYAVRLAGFEEVFFTILLNPAYQDKTITTLLEEVSLSREQVEEDLNAANNEYENLSRLRDKSLNLSQELRQIATRIIEDSSKPDECPLCHTQFEPGELAERIKIGVDEHFEILGKKILSDIQNAKDKKLKLKAIDSASMWLSKFCKQWDQDQEVSVQIVLAEVKKVKSEQAEAIAKLEKLNSEIAAFEAQGFSLEKLEKNTVELRDLGFHFSELSIDTITQLNSKIGHDSELTNREYKKKKTQTEKLHKKLSECLSVHGDSSLDDIYSTIFKLKKNLTTTETLQAKLNLFSTSFPWPAGKPLDELVIEAKSISNVASKLQTALGHEKQASDTSQELSQRRGLLEPKLEKLLNRENRLKTAQSVLERILTDHSLGAAMDSRLQQNRASIESIFSRIHSPAEFQRLGSNWNSLIRKDGREVTLSEISTGQRAAFALSVFLSQNAQIKAAPPVILIDDPIAHVDDLNSLSFLDYLRDIVLTGRRQIFFATANAKLATLFERKFDFLGEEGFRRYNLNR